MAELAHGKIGSVTVEVKPTVTLESAVACVMMLNMFLEDNEGYDLRCVDRGDGWKWELTDEVKPKLQTDKPVTHGIYSGVLSNISNRESEE